jgi:hypothetical protein
MKIIDTNENPVEAACQFYHKGYIVSISTIMRGRGECAFWKESGDDAIHIVDSAGDAIYKIDALLKALESEQ